MTNDALAQRSDYYLPVLELLATLPPHLSEHKIRDIFGEHYEDQIAQAHQELNANGRPKWERHLYWTLNNLRDAGLVWYPSRREQHGTREITPAGRAFLREHAVHVDRGKQVLIERINAMLREHRRYKRN